MAANEIPGGPSSNPRENGASVRLTDAEDAELERAAKFLAELWNVKKVKKSEVIREALKMFFKSLDEKREALRYEDPV